MLGNIINDKERSYQDGVVKEYSEKSSPKSDLEPGHDNQHRYEKSSQEAPVSNACMEQPISAALAESHPNDSKNRATKRKLSANRRHLVNDEPHNAAGDNVWSDQENI